MNYAPQGNSGARATASKEEIAGFVDPLEAARRARVAVSGDVTASAGAEVHGDNFGGAVRSAPRQ
jgi:hypothetical protein